MPKRRPTQAAYNRVERAAAKRVSTLVAQLSSGKIDTDTFGDRFTGILEDFHGRAAAVGRQRSGDFADINDDDRTLGAAVAALEGRFLGGFISDIEDGKYTDDDGDLDAEKVLRRAQFYPKKLLATANEAFVQASSDKHLFDWKLGFTTEDHCDECPLLAAGSPYTLATLPTYPRAGETPCLFNCTCGIVRSDGVTGFLPPSMFAAKKDGLHCEATMNLKRLTFNAAHVKVLDEAQGIAEHIVSVFNNVDHAKERVLPGFFAKSIEAKLPKGVWMHDWTLPVAKTLEAKELLPGDELLPEAIRELGGLYVKAQYNLKTQRGREAFEDVAGGYIDEFSFGFDVAKSNLDTKTGIRDLVEGTIYEWSPVLVGCNPMTQHLSAKDRRSGATSVKSVLGDYLPSSMTMAAAGRASDALYYLLYDVIYGYGNYAQMSVAEKVAVIAEGCDEFSDIVTTAVEALLTAGDKSALEAAAAEVKSLWREPKPETKDAPAATDNTNTDTNTQAEAMKALATFNTIEAAILGA